MMLLPKEKAVYDAVKERPKPGITPQTPGTGRQRFVSHAKAFGPVVEEAVNKLVDGDCSLFCAMQEVADHYSAPAATNKLSI